METARKSTGLRGLKRQQTQERLHEAALRLFLAKGYAATTLDDIAAAAGISRRTIFSYVTGKDEIVFQSIDSILDALVMRVGASSPDQPPLDLLKAQMIGVATAIESKLAVETARFLHGADELNAGRLVRLRQLELALVEALCRVWPDARHLPRLRATAMMAVGALRLGLDHWIEEGSGSSLAACVQGAFGALGSALDARPPARDGVTRDSA